jgi:hypothetical protein
MDVDDTLNTSLNKSQTNRGGKRALSNVNIEPYLEDLFHVVYTTEDETKRNLALAFYLLPSPKLYPDYYEFTQSPIDLKTIAKKIVDKEYKTLKQMEQDLALMMDNAKRYNDPKSLIYKDATRIRRIVRDVTKELTNCSQTGQPYTKITNKITRQRIEELSKITEQPAVLAELPAPEPLMAPKKNEVRKEIKVLTIKTNSRYLNN